MTKLVESSKMNPPNKEESMSFYIDNSESKELYIRCSCGCEILKLEYDEEIDSYYFAVFSLDGRRSWKNRFRMIYHIIKHGEPYSDQLVLESKRINKIVEFVDEINKRNNK